MITMFMSAHVFYGRYLCETGYDFFIHQVANQNDTF